MSEMLTGKTTRSILFRDTTSSTAVMRFDAGTEVYVTERRDGRGFNIRIPGTLLTQHVYAGSVEPF